MSQQILSQTVTFCSSHKIPSEQAKALRYDVTGKVGAMFSLAAGLLHILYLNIGSGLLARFFYCKFMSHPVIPQVMALAQPIAAAMDLEVVNAVFQTNQNPSVLRLDVSCLTGDTSLEHCTEMSRAVEAAIETAELILEAYVLEVSSPGVSDVLSQDRDFVSFKGFPVVVKTTEPYKGQTRWEGTLMRREDEHIFINLKGRPVKIPRDLVQEVRLSEQA